MITLHWLAPNGEDTLHCGDFAPCEIAHDAQREAIERKVWMDLRMFHDHADDRAAIIAGSLVWSDDQ